MKLLKMNQIKKFNELKEHILPLNSFIAGWYIDPKICDDLITLFKSKKEHQKPGVIGGPYSVKKHQKDSIDLGLHQNFTDEVFVKYTKQLKEIVGLYQKKYPEVQQLNKFGMIEGANIQHYPPGAGYFAEHFERMGIMENRCLVWMTYLNDVPEAGTHFKYQNLTTPAKKGLTLIWPTDFTHTHSGQITKHHDKYIITGWMGYIRDDKYKPEEKKQ